MSTIAPTGSTPNRVADAISRGILSRRFAIGQRLVEVDLMRDLGVGRSTVREALHILAAGGVVEMTPHRGAVVRSLSREDAEGLLSVLEVLSGLAARLAADHIEKGTNHKRFTLAAARLLEERSAEELPSILDERANYYKVMFDIADNRELDRVLPHARAHLFRTQFYHYLTKSDLKSMVEEYRSITEAILGGDGSKAEARMRKHIQKTGQRTLPRMQIHTLI